MNGVSEVEETKKHPGLKACRDEACVVEGGGGGACTEFQRLPAMRETRPLEKEMAAHSSTLAWKIPWMEPGRLQSMGSPRVGPD